MADAAPDASAGRRARVLRFGGAGLVAATIDFAVFGAGVALGVAAAFANIAAFLAANAASYLLNARFTFRRDGAPAPLRMQSYGRFLAAHLVSLAFSTAIVAALSPALGPWPAKIIAAVVAAFWNYAASARLVFHR